MKLPMKTPLIVYRNNAKSGKLARNKAVVWRMLWAWSGHGDWNWAMAGYFDWSGGITRR